MIIHLLRSKHWVSVFIPSAYINLMYSEYKDMMSCVHSCHSSLRQCIPITTQLAYFSSLCQWGRLFLKCILVLFLDSILAFKGLLVKYLMVDIEIKNMEYGIWNMGYWGFRGLADPKILAYLKLIPS